MTVKELRNKSVKEMEAELQNLERTLRENVMANGSRNLKETHMIRRNKRAIAQVKTIIGEQIRKDAIEALKTELSEKEGK